MADPAPATFSQESSTYLYATPGSVVAGLSRIDLDGQRRTGLDLVEKAVAVPIRQINPAVPTPLANAISGLHERNPKNRQTAESIANLLQSLADPASTATFRR